MDINLTNSEMIVMQGVWKAWDGENPVTIKDISKHIDKNWDRCTYHTFMMNLIRKQLLRVERNGKANEYYPLCSQRGFQQASNKQLIKDLHNSSISSFVTSLVSDSDISDEFLAELQKVLIVNLSNK